MRDMDPPLQETTTMQSILLHLVHQKRLVEAKTEQVGLPSGKRLQFAIENDHRNSGFT